MASRFENFKAGVVDDNPLLVGAVTLTSSGLSQLQTITAPDWAYLVLDPDGSAGAPEVVKVTNHAGAATTATITRAQDGTTARQHLLNTVWRHALVKADLDELPFRKVTTKGDVLAATAATTVSRLAVGTDGQILRAASGQATGLQWTSSIDVQVFTGSGTWNKPAGAVSVEGVVIGSGGGSGSGRRGAAGTDRYGGSGGGGGEVVPFRFAASLLGGTETITIGAAGTAGAAITVDNTNGNPGVAGGDSSIGTKVVARGGALGVGGASSPGNTATSGAGFLNAGDPGVGGGSGVIPATGGPGNSITAPGGGAGGGKTVADSTTVGSAGGSSAGAAGGAGGAATGAVGSPGTAATASSGLPGGGGGGGGGSAAGAGGAGGAGAVYGAGAGGGAGCLNGNNSGAGAAGAAGIVIIISHF